MKIEDDLIEPTNSDLVQDLIESIDRLGVVMANIQPPHISVPVPTAAPPTVNPIINVSPAQVTVKPPDIHIHQHSEWVFKFERDINQNVDTVTAKAIK